MKQSYDDDALAGRGGGDAKSDVEQIENDVKETEQEVRGSMAPQATEPLLQRHLQYLTQAAGKAVSSLSGGEFEGEMPAIEGDQQQVPPQLFDILNGVSQFIEQGQGKVPELRQYEFDPVEAAKTNDGIVDAAMKIEGLAADSKVAESIRKAQKQQAGAKESPADDTAAENKKPDGGKYDGLA